VRDRCNPATLRTPPASARDRRGPSILNCPTPRQAGTVATAAALGDGAANAVTFITGTTTTKLLWPEDSIPSTFTVCSVTRYTGGSRGRFMTCENSPSQALAWTHGHWDGNRGIAYYNGWKASSANKGVLDDWLVMCGTNAGATAPGSILIDQDEIGTADGGVGGCRLNINYKELSDWALHSVLIWDYSLGTFPALWHSSATLSQVLLTWFFPWCDLGMRRAVFSGQGDWGRRHS